MGDDGLYAEPIAEVYVSNSILWDNDPNDPNDPNNLIVAAGAVVTIDYSVVAGGWSGSGGNNTDEGSYGVAAEGTTVRLGNILMAGQAAGISVFNNRYS